MVSIIYGHPIDNQLCRVDAEEVLKSVLLLGKVTRG